jgi:HK97 family phage prohead protease
MSILYHKADQTEVEFQFRALADGSSVFEGYAAVFNQPSKPIADELAIDGKRYIETVTPGSFRRTLGTPQRQSFVVDHNERMMISSRPNGQLRMAEDTRGLHVESPWPRTDYADNVRALHDAGERLGMSMMFGTTPKGATWDATHTKRTVNEAILRHVSVLATMEPAYAGTSAAFRALAEMTSAEVEDVDALVEALREGRRLEPGEYNLLNRLAEAVKPEASPESVAPAAEYVPDEATVQWIEKAASKFATQS